MIYFIPCKVVTFARIDNYLIFVVTHFLDINLRNCDDHPQYLSQLWSSECISSSLHRVSLELLNLFDVVGSTVHDQI